MKELHLEKELRAVDAILVQLNQCLMIHYKSKNRDYFNNTLKDIQKCKVEKKRLIAAKEAEMDAIKGAAENHEPHKRRRKTIS